MATNSRLVSALALLAVSASCQAVPDPEGSLPCLSGPAELTLQTLFQGERFPCIVAAADGSLVATWGSSRVVSRRSSDGGFTWEPEVTVADPGFQGGGALLDEASGDLLAFVESGHPPAELTVYRSADAGRSWSPSPHQLLPNSLGHVPSMHMNDSGLSLLRGEHRGRLLRPSRYYGEGNEPRSWSQHYTNAIYSDDGGLTWQASEPFPEPGTGEAAVVQLMDGTLYYNTRVHWDQRPDNTRRRSATSRDGGRTWRNWRLEPTLPDGRQDRSYGCMGGLVRLPVLERDILVFSNLDTDSARRERVTVWVSFDGGQSWPLKRLVFDGPSAYSSLTAGRPGTASEGWIFLQFEGGPEGGCSVARFNLAWLMEGEPTGDGEVPAWALAFHDLWCERPGPVPGA